MIDVFIIDGEDEQNVHRQIKNFKQRIEDSECYISSPGAKLNNGLKVSFVGVKQNSMEMGLNEVRT